MEQYVNNKLAFSNMKTARRLRGIGVFLIVFFGVFGTLGVTFGNKEALAFSVSTYYIIYWALAALGIYLFLVNHKKMKLLEKLRLYTNYFKSKDLRNFEQLQKNVNEPIETIKNELQKMIDYEYLLHATIDENQNCIVFDERAAKKQ